VDDPRVLVDGLVHDDGSHLVWLVSESPEETKVEPVVETGARLTTLDGESVDGPVALPAYGVTVLRLHPTDDPTTDPTTDPTSNLETA
jgi:hypothetical protein